MKGNRVTVSLVFVIIIQWSSFEAFQSAEVCHDIENSDCSCDPNRFEFSCPKMDPKIFVTLYDVSAYYVSIRIRCNASDGDHLSEILPDLKIGYMKILLMNNCSKSNVKSMWNITNKFGIQTVEELYFINNKTEVLNTSFLAGVSLIIVAINSKVEELPKNFFAESPLMQKLTLSKSFLKTLPDNIFAKQTQLTRLDLSQNELRILPDGLFDTTESLTILNLSFNKLQEINESLLHHLYQLKELYLNDNALHFIHPNAFVNTREVIVLDLSTNLLGHEGYPYENSSIFHSVAKFFEVVTPTNYFFDFFFDRISSENEFVKDGSHNLFKSLRPASNPIYVDLSQNSLEKITNNDLLLLEHARQWNRESYRFSEWIINLNYNRFVCDCKILNFVHIVQGGRFSRPGLSTFQFLTNYLKCQLATNHYKVELVSEVDEKDLVCELETPIAIEKYCPPKCDCWIHFLNHTIVLNCSNTQMIEVPPLPSIPKMTKSITILSEIPKDKSMALIEKLRYELHIENNQLKALPALNGEGYESVSKIYAQNNSIGMIAIENLSRNLSFLDLSYNKLEKLNLNILEYFNKSKTFNKLILENNWWCNCDRISDILRFWQLHSKIDFEKIICNDGEFMRNKIVHCLMINRLLISSYVLLLLIGFSIGAVIAIYYKKQQEIHVWLFAHNCCLWLVTEDELDKDKKFDAFISFSHKDERFVTEVLLPELEKEPNPFKICIHSRDWTVGHYIPDQIAKSVEDSRRTIIVLSTNFLESIWGLMELRVAHQNALGEKRTRVIVILHGDIGKMDDLDPELKAYLTTNTYLEWNDPRFFDKLRYALPHPNNHKLRQRKGSKSEKRLIEVVDDRNICAESQL